jgi:GT2 family glycosyltransferase
MSNRIAICIPTIGRAAILRETLEELTRQSRPAESVIVCGTKSVDVEGIGGSVPDLKIILSEPGSSRQRNAAMAASDTDIVVFFDDDFLPHPEYIAEIDRVMGANPGIVVATGHVIADGIIGPGFSAGEGRSLLANRGHRSTSVRPIFAGYGCNMAVRLGPVRQHNIQFDERLPLYAWQEDVDLSRRLAKFGDVVCIEAACGVHRGVKSGRGSGVKLGYSQVANPLYLSSKRMGYPLGRALHHIAKNMAMNIARAPHPEPYVDRRGRLRGNLLALRDLLSGRMIPERILELG